MRCALLVHLVKDAGLDVGGHGAPGSAGLQSRMHPWAPAHSCSSISMAVMHVELLTGPLDRRDTPGACTSIAPSGKSELSPALVGWRRTRSGCPDAFSCCIGIPRACLALPSPSSPLSPRPPAPRSQFSALAPLPCPPAPALPLATRRTSYPRHASSMKCTTASRTSSAASISPTVAANQASGRSGCDLNIRSSPRNVATAVAILSSSGPSTLGSSNASTIALCRKIRRTGARIFTPSVSFSFVYDISFFTFLFPPPSVPSGARVRVYSYSRVPSAAFASVGGQSILCPCLLSLPVFRDATRLPRPRCKSLLLHRFVLFLPPGFVLHRLLVFCLPSSSMQEFTLASHTLSSSFICACTPPNEQSVLCSSALSHSTSPWLFAFSSSI